jgi:hypothetical protein
MPVTVMVTVTVDLFFTPPLGCTTSKLGQIFARNQGPELYAKWLSAVASSFPLGLLTVFVHLSADLPHLPERPSRKSQVPLPHWHPALGVSGRRGRIRRGSFLSQRGTSRSLQPRNYAPVSI